jgi:hypothetical protein
MPMAQYECWSESDGETLADAKTITAFAPDDAAEQRACQSYTEDPFEMIEIAVQLPEGGIDIFVVEVEERPVFRAVKKSGR